MGIVSAVDLGPFAAANNEFAASLYHELRQNEGNLFFSPFSIRSGLILAYFGARGRTARQMAEVMRLPDADAGLCRAVRGFDETLLSRMDKGAIEVDVANAIWKQQGMPMLATYAEMVREALGAELFEVDYSGPPAHASRTINRWVHKKTRKQISQIVSPEMLGPQTQLCLTNAIYFNAAWRWAFSRRETVSSAFHLWTGDPLSKMTVHVPMMHQELIFGYARFDGLEILEMPYLGDQVSMIVLLPALAHGWVDLEKQLSAIQLSQWVRALRPAMLSVSFPRFQVQTSLSLAGTLSGMGMAEAFSTELADFSGMTPEKPFGITTAIHTAKVEVNEVGTRAAAATGVLLGRGMKPAFVADHPFLFLIRDVELDAILFMGRVLNPAQ